MTQAVYEWMKNLAVFYIFLTVVMNLMPDSQYGEYMRFFMGLLLILLILAPMLQVLDAGESVEQLFRSYTRQQEEQEWIDQQEQLRETDQLYREYQQKLYDAMEEEEAGVGEDGEIVAEDAQ